MKTKKSAKKPRKGSAIAKRDNRIEELEAQLSKAMAEKNEMLAVVQRANVAFDRQDVEVIRLKDRLSEPKGVREARSAFAMLDARRADDQIANNAMLGVSPDQHSLTEAMETIEGLRVDQRNRMQSLQNANIEIAQSSATIQALRNRIKQLEEENAVNKATIERLTTERLTSDSTRVSNEDAWRGN